MLTTDIGNAYLEDILRFDMRWRRHGGRRSPAAADDTKNLTLAGKSTGRLRGSTGGGSGQSEMMTRIKRKLPRGSGPEIDRQDRNQRAAKRTKEVVRVSKSIPISG